MYKRFHVDLQCGGKILRDMEGVETVDLTRALATAQDVLREMRESGELPDSEDGWYVLVKREDGVVLATLPVE